MDSRLYVYIIAIFITLSSLSSQSFSEKRFYLDIDNNGSITNEIDDYLELVDQLIPPENNYNRDLSWNYAEYIMGLGLIHLQRADSRLIDAMLIGSDHLLSKRNDYLDNLKLFIDEKPLPVWPALEKRWSFNNEPVTFTNHLMTANILQPIALTAFVLANSENSAYQKKSRYYLEEVERVLNEYSFSNLWFDEINKLFTHANSSRISQINEISEEKIGKPTSYNRNFMMATVLYLVLETKKIHKETDNNIDRYKNTISSIINNFKNDSQIIDYDDNNKYLLWNFDNSKTSDQAQIEDIFHGGLVALSLMILFDDKNDYFNINQSFLHSLSNTYLLALQKPPPATLEFFEYIDGTGDNLSEQRRVSNLFWCELSLVNKAIWEESCGVQLENEGVSVRDGFFLASGIALKIKLARMISDN